jgi:hypothetical protein
LPVLFFAALHWPLMKPSALHLTLLSFVGILLSLPAGASTLYKCTDDSGTVLFTDQKSPKRKCVVLSVQTPPAPRSGTGVSVGAGTAPAGNPAPRAANNPTPSDFPRVSGDQQKARDTDRRAILDRELAAEQAHLDKARQALGSNPAQAAQSQRDTAALHERNIEALNKEIAKLR